MPTPRQPLSGNNTIAPLAVSWLSDDRHGAQLLTAAREHIAVEQAAKQALPTALAQVCRVARIERQHMTLAVPAAAYAAKLRQLAPSMMRKLHDSGWNISQISVKVQANLAATQTKKAPRQITPLGATALKAFETLHEELQPGPLADAVQRLLQRHQQPAQDS